MMRNPYSETLGIQRGKAWKFFSALAVASVLGTMWLMGGVVCAESKKAPKQADFQKLEGKWVRPDGGYILELKDIKKDGSLKAFYYNPRPIKVFVSTWNRKDGKINLFVELRDINYPGSKYNLQYDTPSDCLKGTYFQAVEKQTFAVEFVRFR